MDILNKLYNSLGLNNNMDYRFIINPLTNSKETIPQIVKIIDEILDDKDKLDYVLNNYELFKKVLLEHCDNKLTDYNNIYDIIKK